jgi:alpha-glucosidase
LRYAGQHGVGVILYVNQKALDSQLEELLPLYRNWGVKGVKFGFVNVGSQAATAWLHRAVRMAATNQLLVDIHDEYRPTGWERTYPNLLTVEGVRGDEESSPASQEITTLFTRLLAGPADHTICYFDSRVDRVWSHGFQLAKAVCYYSPWQFLYWYDRPPAPAGQQFPAGDRKPPIVATLEQEFFSRVPTTWDETRVLAGSPGEYAIIARRHGEDWFVGVMNGGSPRRLKIPLGFLDPKRPYTAHVYRDDVASKTPTRVGVERIAVTHQSILECDLADPGGQAIHLSPQRVEETNLSPSPSSRATSPPSRPGPGAGR